MIPVVCMLCNYVSYARAQSSSTTSSPYVSSSFASSAALSSAIFCVRNSLISFCMFLSDEESSARYATRSAVDGEKDSAESSAVKDRDDEVGEV